jgi:Helix-turn-helix domain
MADQFTSEKFQWLEQITFDQFSESLGDAIRVGFAISTFVNRKTGEAWPGLDRLASILGSNEKTVRRAIEWLEKRGHLRLIRLDLIIDGHV